MKMGMTSNFLLAFSIKPLQLKEKELKEKGKGKVGGKKGRLAKKQNLTCAKQNFK
jgi:hypothetical protein